MCSPVNCGIPGAFAGCDTAELMGCHGDLEEVTGSQTIRNAKWAELCALSKVPFVTTIAGGRYL